MKLIPSARAKAYSGTTSRYSTGCGWCYVTVNVDESGYPIEVFARIGKVGGCSSAFLESIGRTLSVALRCGVDARELADQYNGIQCMNGGIDGGVKVTSCASAVGMAITRVLGELTKKESSDGQKTDRPGRSSKSMRGDAGA